MQISFRGLLVVGMFSLALAAMAYAGHMLKAADGRAKSSPTVSTVEIGRLLSGFGLEPKLQDQRFDFNFKAKHKDGEEWDLSMSVALSNNKKSLWVMAWLDKLPRTSSEVPRSALLQLLSDNDHLGNGKFFAYVAANRRFVLQTVIPADDLNSATLKAAMTDLGTTVILTYPHWNVEGWRQEAAEIAESDREEALEEAAEEGISEFAKSLPEASRR